MTEKQLTMEQLEETVKRTDEQLDLMGWKMDNVEKQMVVPLDSQDVCLVNLLKSVSEEESEPIRAAALRSFFSRRVGTGYTLQRADPTKNGEYYIELRVYNTHEAEKLGSDRWKRALITCKGAVEAESGTWRAVTKLVTAVKEEYSAIQPILYPYNLF